MKKFIDLIPFVFWREIKTPQKIKVDRFQHDIRARVPKCFIKKKISNHFGRPYNIFFGSLNLTFTHNILMTEYLIFYVYDGTK